MLFGGIYIFKIVRFLEELFPFIITQYLSLSLIAFFDLKSALSEINMVTTVFFFNYSTYIFLHQLWFGSEMPPKRFMCSEVEVLEGD